MHGDLEVSERPGEGNTREQNSSILSDDDLELEKGKCDCMQEQGGKMGEGNKEEVRNLAASSCPICVRKGYGKVQKR